MSVSNSKSMSRPLAFIAGFAGMLVFALLALGVANRAKDRGQGYEDARSDARHQWRATADQAAAALQTNGWKDKAEGLVRVAADDYLPIAAKALASPESVAHLFEKDEFIAPGTEAHAQYTARLAAEAEAAKEKSDEEEGAPAESGAEGN